jgi:hypothetical protein
MGALAQLRYGLVSCLGRLLSDVELNAVSAMSVDQQTYFAKRRLRFVAPLIAAGNLYLKREGAHARVLSDRNWRNWETEVYRAIYDIELVTDERGRLCVPARAGVSLAALLESESGTEAEKLSAIGLAVRSLFRLHTVAVRWPDGQKRPLSHGDATVENVIIDDAREKASWLDFDTIHDGRMDAAWRYADDLRALTYSAAARVPAPSFPELTRSIVANYGATAPLDALREMVAYRWNRPISFHLAQAPVGYRQRRLLDEALQRSLSQEV